MRRKFAARRPRPSTASIRRFQPARSIQWTSAITHAIDAHYIIAKRAGLEKGEPRGVLDLLRRDTGKSPECARAENDGSTKDRKPVDVRPRKKGRRKPCPAFDHKWEDAALPELAESLTQIFGRNLFHSRLLQIRRHPRWSRCDHDRRNLACSPG